MTSPTFLWLPICFTPPVDRAVTNQDHQQLFALVLLSFVG